MVRQGAWAGALVLLASAHWATARADTLEHDEVALVQFAAAAHGDRAAELVKQAADVEQSLNSVLAKQRRSQLSLLAVNASRAARWYDMDDTALLRKLHDRMKANEEKEQAVMANAQVASEGGALNASAFLGQGASAKGNRFDATHWLTQSDLDHYAEDERRLQQLSGELQRVAASIARVATHQRDIGEHLGLPDPSKVKFEPGEKIEVLSGEGGKNSGTWAKASVIGPGDRPNTWNVHVISAKKGKQDLANVPAVSLRKDEDANEKVFDPSEVKYEVDEQAQVQIAVGPQSGQWVKCSIRSKADLPDAYNIYVPSAPPGHRDIPSVPSRVLRKAESKALFSQYDLDGNGQLSSEEFQIAVREKATTVYEEKRGSQQLYRDGETVQLFSMEGVSRGMWINVTVMGLGDLANTWNIFIPDAQPGFQYVSNIPSERLKKVGEEKTAAEAAGHPIRVIPAQADHEVLMQRGDYKGKWVPCELRRKSDAGDSHTIWVPFGAPDGRSIMPNIAPDQLRVRKTCGEGFEAIFDADSPGWDHYDRPFNHKETAEACAADCSRRFSCGSFEWSPSIKECHLNRVPNPSLPANGDYLFCRRSRVPTSASELWKGPWIGQELEYLIDQGQFNGTWQPCNITGYGQKPDTYTINGSVAFLGRPEKVANWSGVPASHLRYLTGESVPSLFDNWEPPEGEDALYSRILNNATQLDNSTAQPTEEALAANASAANASTAEAAPAAPPEAAELMNLSPAKVSEAHDREDLAAELAAEAEEDLEAMEDLGQDLPEGLFRANQLAEVKQADNWVRCHVLGKGKLTNTYNLRLLNATEGSQDLKNIPVAAMRKVQSLQEADETALDAQGIDGDVGESVEVLVGKGPRAGEWVPAVIKGHGSVQDTYDIKVPGINSTNKVVKNVKGAALRRTSKKVIVEEEQEWPLYTEGEQTVVTMPFGRNTSVQYSCTIKARGAAKHTYDLEVPSFGALPAAHARLLQKLPEAAAAAAAKEAEEPAVSVKGMMKVIEGLKPDLMPVVKLITETKKDLRTWFRRFADWEMGCDQEDHQRMLAKLQEVSAMSPEGLKASVPEECSLAHWTPKDRQGVAWDNLAACVQAASNTSRACSGCPVKFLASAADRCTVKCTAMMSSCRDEADQAKGKCQLQVGRCLDCLQGPLEDLLQCAEVPERLSIMGAVTQMVKNSKSPGGRLQVEASLRDALQVASFLQIDKFARQTLRALLFSWGTISSRREL